MTSPAVLFVSGEYPPMQGGVGAYTAELAHALAGQGVQVSVLTAAQAAAGEQPAAGVRVFAQASRWGPSIWRSAAALAHTVGAAWVHVQYQTAAYAMNPAVNFAPAAWRRQGLRVGWTYHDLLVPYLFPKAGAPLRRWVTERPARLADLVVATNEGDRAQLARLEPAHLVSIPIGSNIRSRTLTPAERRARRAKRGYGDDDFVLAYFGFLNRSKGGLALVRVLDQLAARHPNVRLLMIGERVGASDPTNYVYLREVESLIAERGLAGRVQWTGRQDDDEVAADLNACDVLLLPYLDGASLRRGTLMAGLANGCAIVTTRPQAPLPELVAGRDLLYAEPGDDAALAAAVEGLLADPALLAALRSKARARSRLFTWEAIARAHLAAYSRVEGQA